VPSENDPNDDQLAGNDLPDVGAEVEAELSKLRPGDDFDYRRRHPLDQGPRDTDEIVLDDDGEPWSNL
jgi:hypothetical protein